MTKVHLMLIIVLQLGFNLNLTKAGSDREHVHIKVHIPEMVKKHTHVRKVHKHYFHPKKIHIPELDSSFAGGGLGALSYYPLGLGASEHTLHEYPMDFGQNLPLFPSEITPTSSHMATFNGGNIEENVMMNFMPEMSKSKLKVPSFVGNNKFYSKLSTKKFPTYSGNQFGQMMGNNVNIGGGGGGGGVGFGIPGGNIDHMNQMEDEMRTKFHVDYDDDSNDELDDSTYSDESDIKTVPNGELMQMQNNMYSPYTPDSIASTSSIASNQYKKNLLPTYSQGSAGINAGNSMAIKWYTDEEETPEWTMAANESPTSMMKNSYTLPAYGSGHLPKKKKLQTMSEVSGQNMKFAAAAGDGGGRMATGHDDERWIAKRKKAKYEKNRRRRPSRASSPFYRFSY